MPEMALALLIFGVACAAFCVWLTVRVVNRRERWAKWTLNVMGLPVLYVGSFGPFIWLSDHQLLTDGTSLPVVSRVYVPIIFAGRVSYTFRCAMDWYVSFWSDFDIGWFEWSI
jgi:hypothetical protein